MRVQDEGELRDKKREELEAQMRVIVDKMRLVSSPTAIRYMEEDLTKIEQQINDLDARKGELETQGGVDMPTILKYIEYFVEHPKMKKFQRSTSFSSLYCLERLHWCARKDLNLHALRH